MKASLAISLLAPVLATAFRVNSTVIPGMTMTEFPLPADFETSDYNLTKRAAPAYQLYYGDSCDGANGYHITENQESPCHDFLSGPPKYVRWHNPYDSDGKSYWNMILYFHGDECPVVGHPIQCDSATDVCVGFTDSRPLSYNIVEATSGIRNCDV